MGAQLAAGAPLVKSLRLPAVMGALTVALVVVCSISVLIGSADVGPQGVRAVLAGDGSAADQAVVLGMRVPRTVLGVLCGVALGVAGALTQAHTRNPLADPGLIGINAGASLGAVVAITYLGFTSPSTYVWAALVGGVLAGSAVLLLVDRIRLFEPVTTVVLIGAVLTALFNSITTGIGLFNPASAESFQAWSVGSLVGRDLSVAAGVAPVFAIGLLAACLNLPALPGLELGDEMAAALGRRAAVDRVIGLGAVVLLAGAATAAAGTLGFLGLLAPHVARVLVRARPIATVIVAGLAGPVILLTADVVGRISLATSEVEVGIMLAIFGAPLFIALARRLRTGPRS